MKRLKLTEELERLLVTHEMAVRLDVDLSHTSGAVKKERIRTRSTAAWGKFNSRLEELEHKLRGLQGEKDA